MRLPPSWRRPGASSSTRRPSCRHRSRPCSAARPRSSSWPSGSPAPAARTPTRSAATTRSTSRPPTRPT